MEESRIIKVEICQGDIKHRLPIGEFQKRLVAEMADIPFRSRIFSTKGIVDRFELERQISSATARVIQRIRDGQ